MLIPLQITFRGIPKSEAVEARIREKVDKLERFSLAYYELQGSVEAEHQHHHQGNQYHIRIDITTPRKELVISRSIMTKRLMKMFMWLYVMPLTRRKTTGRLFTGSARCC